MHLGINDNSQLQTYLLEALGIMKYFQQMSAICRRYVLVLAEERLDICRQVQCLLKHLPFTPPPDLAEGKD